MKIELTKQQYETLLELMYLGNWMANSHRTTDLISRYEEMEQLIHSFWDELQFRLAKRDAFAKNPKATMEDVIRFEKNHHQEFRTHGLKRLGINAAR